MLCRPGAGRQKAISGETSVSAAFRSAPCQAPGPYPSSRTRVRNRASGVSETALLLVLMKASFGLNGMKIGSVDAPRAKLAFKLPGSAVSLERFAHPMEGVRGNLSKTPTCGCAICPRANLNDVLANLAANLLLAMPSYRIDPVDTPCLNRGIPNAQCRPVHVVGLIQIRVANGTSRHDPDILDGAALQRPPEVRLALNMARRNINRLVVKHL